VRLLLDAGADPDVRIGGTDQTPTDLAATGGHADVVAMLREARRPAPPK